MDVKWQGDDDDGGFEENKVKSIYLRSRLHTYIHTYIYIYIYSTHMARNFKTIPFNFAFQFNLEESLLR